MDFSFLFYGPGIDGTLTMSEDECSFFNMTHPYDLPNKNAQDYMNKLAVYQERFGQHMPIPVRKELLKGMVTE